MVVTPGSVRGSVVAAVLAGFGQRGGDPAPLLRRHGLGGEIPAGSDASVPLARYVALFEDMAQAIGDPLLGARLGLTSQPTDLGPAGLIMARSGSMKAALHRLSRFFDSLQRSTYTDLREADGCFVCAYQLSDRAIWPRRQDAEYTLSSQVRLFRSAFKADLRPVEVQFEHAAIDPPTTRALEELFKCPIRYAAATNAVVLRLDDVRTSCRTEEKDLMDLLESYMGELVSRHDRAASWQDQVQRLIAVHLGRTPVTIERLASDLAISPRSLQRRLAAEGTSLRQLLRAQRQDLVARHFAAGSAPLGSLAEALGYADGTTFWRAHRSWTGQSPRSARARRPTS